MYEAIIQNKRFLIEGLNITEAEKQEAYIELMLIKYQLLTHCSYEELYSIPFSHIRSVLLYNSIIDRIQEEELKDLKNGQKQYRHSGKGN